MSLTLHGRVQDTTKTIAQGMNVENKSAVRVLPDIQSLVSRELNWRLSCLVAVRIQTGGRGRGPRCVQPHDPAAHG